MSDPQASSTSEAPEISALETRVLVVLAAGDRHGYGIAKELQRLGGPAIYPANLYRHLRRLAERGLIEPGALETDSSGRPRKLFAITPLGLEAVRREGVRLRGLVDELETVLSPGTSVK